MDKSKLEHYAQLEIARKKFERRQYEKKAKLRDSFIAFCLMAFPIAYISNLFYDEMDTYRLIMSFIFFIMTIIGIAMFPFALLEDYKQKKRCPEL